MIDIRKLKDLSYDVISVIHAVHKELGPGLNEYCYQEGFELELKDWNLTYEREKMFHPVYKGIIMESQYRLDFLCEDEIIIECKSVQKLTKEHRAQLFNYLRLCKKQVGILVNFAPRYAEIERYFYDDEKMEIIGADGISISKFRDYFD